jgi:predicted thioesterase
MVAVGNSLVDSMLETALVEVGTSANQKSAHACQTHVGSAVAIQSTMVVARRSSVHAQWRMKDAIEKRVSASTFQDRRLIQASLALQQQQQRQ